MLNDWQNRGVLLWKIYTTAVTVSTSVTSYDLSSSTTDALQVNLRRDSTDIELQRISFEEYLNVPNKSQAGRPTQYTVKRDLANPTIHIYPVPDNATDILKIEAIRQVEDINKSADQNADTPVRFLPALTCGLSYYLSMKRNNIPMDRIQMLKANYEEKLAMALEEDRERASLLLKPKLGYI